MSVITRHMSVITCHMSVITCHMTQTVHFTLVLSVNAVLLNKYFMKYKVLRLWDTVAVRGQLFAVINVFYIVFCAAFL